MSSPISFRSTRLTEISVNCKALKPRFLSQNLMDTKIALDMEIAVFRRLLESEEDRLGIAGPDALGKER